MPSRLLDSTPSADGFHMPADGGAHQRRVTQFVKGVEQPQMPGLQQPLYFLKVSFRGRLVQLPQFKALFQRQIVCEAKNLHSFSSAQRGASWFEMPM